MGALNMADRITRTTHQGYFSRLANSFFGVLIGFLLVPGSVLLMSWNEHRTIHRTKGLIEAESVVAEVADPLEVLSTFDQRLVHVTGKAATDETLKDTEFPIERQALRLERQVEMYQWVEHKDSKTRDRIGGGRETITTYEYRKEWKTDRVDSERFEERDGHANPQPRFSSASLVAEHAMLGAYHFRPDLVRSIRAWQSIRLDLESLLAKFDEESKKQFKLDDDRLYFSSSLPDPSAPKIGDLKLRFRVIEQSVVSLLSKQSDHQFAPFKTSNGEMIELVQEGEVPTALMFQSLRSENSFWAWILRGLGWGLCCVGFSLIAGPIKALSNFFPPLAGILGFATTGLAFLLGSIVALVSIGIAWLAVRPVLGVSLLVLAGFGIYLLRRRKQKQEIPMAVLAE